MLTYILAWFQMNNNILKNVTIFSLISLCHISYGFDFKIIYVFFTFSILYIISISVINKIILIILSGISIIYLPVGFLYGEPNFNTVASLYSTNTIESIEFLCNIPIKYIILSFLIAALCFLCCRFDCSFPKKYRGFVIFFVVVVAIASPLKDIIKRNNIVNIGIPEWKFASKLFHSIKEFKLEKKKLEGYMNNADTFENVKFSGKYNTYVVVIGESVRKDYMHMYGFEINNTPFMDSTNGVRFLNYISAGSSTLPSLTNSLTQYPNLSNNIITLAKKAGLYTYWISNQGFIGDIESPISSIGRKADEYFFLKKGGYNSKIKYQDSDLLPKISESINSNKVVNGKLIVIHLMGSHTPTCHRTNGEYDIFYGNIELSCYIQSIKNTDKLLSNIQSLLTDTNSMWSMMYFSDHGLSFNKKSIKHDYELIHSDAYKQSFEVPFFITSFDSNEKKSISAERSGLNFLGLFSEWIGIESSNTLSSCRYLSEENCNSEGIKVYNYKNQKIDFQQIPRQEKIY